jgi:uncharacterized metal-binding protein YceD (DUF177 family)
MTMIDLDKIPDSGLLLNGHAEEFFIERGVVLHDVVWQIFIMPPSPDFFIEIKGNATMVASCACCLESVSVAILVDSQFLGSNDNELMIDGNYTLSRQDLDVVFFTGAILDEKVIIREHFQLQIPIRILCRDNCKGLCHYCGNNQNKSDCSCSLESINKHSSALARALVNLKLNLNDDVVSDSTDA